MTTKKTASFSMGTTPIQKAPTIRNQMMIKSTADNKKKGKQITTTEKLAAMAAAIQRGDKPPNSDRSSAEINLGSYQAEKMEDIDPLDYIEGYTFSKRDFLMELFKEYNALPLKKSLTNFSYVFNDVFIREIPSIISSYALYEL